MVTLTLINRHVSGSRKQRKEVEFLSPEEAGDRLAELISLGFRLKSSVDGGDDLLLRRSVTFQWYEEARFLFHREPVV